MSWRNASKRACAFKGMKLTYETACKSRGCAGGSSPADAAEDRAQERVERARRARAASVQCRDGSERRTCTKSAVSK
jgi:hypothetical protein